MKKLYSFIILLLLAGSIQAQSLSPQNATLLIPGDGTSLLQGYVDIYNIGNTDLDVLVERTVDNLAVNHVSNFCWGPACYPPNVSISPLSEFIPVGGFSNTFRGDLNPNFTSGLSRVTYCFYDMNNQSDSICMEFVYDITTGINEVNNAASFVSNPTPNPADAFTTISYRLAKQASEIKLVIHSIIGSEVAQLKLNGQQKIMMINTSALKSGVYFYSVIADRAVINTNRLVVSHKN